MRNQLISDLVSTKKIQCQLAEWEAMKKAGFEHGTPGGAWYIRVTNGLLAPDRLLHC